MNNGQENNIEVSKAVVADFLEFQENNIEVSKAAVADFLEFLENKSEYLDTGLGAFHTDNHSNW